MVKEGRGREGKEKRRGKNAFSARTGTQAFVTDPWYVPAPGRGHVPRGLHGLGGRRPPGLGALPHCLCWDVGPEWDQAPALQAACSPPRDGTAPPGPPSLPKIMSWHRDESTHCGVG